MNRDLINKISELFEIKLQEKNGWGKNEVLKAYKECVIEAILEVVDDRDKQN